MSMPLAPALPPAPALPLAPRVPGPGADPDRVPRQPLAAVRV
jgi:hypothetical protein